MIKITNNIYLDDKEIKWHFIRASGPGGQKVNKIATAAQLRFRVQQSSLPDEIKTRLILIGGNRINVVGELVITGRRYRTQKQNRQDALRRLIHFIDLASHKPKRRKKTKISRAVKQQRLVDKRRRGAVKRLRQRPASE